MSKIYAHDIGCVHVHHEVGQMPVAYTEQIVTHAQHCMTRNEVLTKSIETLRGQTHVQKNASTMNK